MKRILVVSPRPLTPQSDGIRAKTIARCRQFAHVAEVTVVSLGADPADSGTFAHGTRLIEHRIAPPPLDPMLPSILGSLGRRDLFFGLAAERNGILNAALERAVAAADVVVAQSIFAYETAARIARGPLVLDAPVIETVKADDDFLDDTRGREARILIADLEGSVLVRARHILTAGAAERDALVAAGASPASITVIPPVAWSEKTSLPSRTERQAKKAQSNFAGAVVALFAGSATRSNLETIAATCMAAPFLPSVRFVILGGVIDSLRELVLPPNVGVTGVVTDALCASALEIADVCYDLGGSLTMSSKLQAYAWSGTPIVAENSGASRAGLPENGFYGASAASLAEAIAATLNDPGAADRRAASAFAAMRHVADAAVASIEMLVNAGFSA